MRILRNFLILMLAAGGIIVVSVLLTTNVNQALGGVVMLMLITLLAPLAQRLIQLEKLSDLFLEAIGGVLGLLIIWGYGWGFAHVFEHWHKGWGWIGWFVGPFVALCAGLALFRVWYGKHSQREYERDKLTAYQNVLEKPGISHTALLKTVGRDNATGVLRELLREKRIKLERRGRVRRYFAQSEDYDETIRQNPEDAKAYYNRGIACKIQGNKAKAITDFEKFITLTKNPRLIEMARQEIKELSK